MPRGIRTDLHGRGHYYFLGTPLQHQPNEIYLLDNFFRLYKFAKIVEIGTNRGGLSVLFGLHSWMNNGWTWTFDIHNKVGMPTKWLLKNLPVKVMIGDVFERLECEFIKERLNSVGRTLLYCDGGDKDKEFNLFAPYLKIDDIIMAHDRGTKEIPYDNIKDTVQKYNLVPIFEKEIKKLECRIFMFRKSK